MRGIADRWMTTILGDTELTDPPQGRALTLNRPGGSIYMVDLGGGRWRIAPIDHATLGDPVGKPVTFSDLRASTLRLAGTDFGMRETADTWLSRVGDEASHAASYQDGRVQYQRLAHTSLFKAGIERVLLGAKTYRVALMCAEKEPLDCHRTLLVSRALERKGTQVLHILSDGSVEAQTTTMERLVSLMELDRNDLFATPERRVEEACRLRESKTHSATCSRPPDGNVSETCQLPSPRLRESHCPSAGSVPAAVSRAVTMSPSRGPGPEESPARRTEPACAWSAM